MRGLIATALLCCALLEQASGAESPADADPLQVTFRATSALPDNVIKYIAEVSVPANRIIPANQKPEDFIAGVCGSFTETYRDAFISLNSTPRPFMLRPDPSPRPVKMPACAHWRRDGSVRVAQGDQRLDDVLIREIGRASADILQRCGDRARSFRCDAPLRDIVQRLNPGRDLDHLKPGTELVLPVVTRSVSFRVKPELGLSAAAVAQNITDLAAGAPGIRDTNPIVRNVATPELINLVRPVGIGDPTVQDPACREASSRSAQRAKPWPFDIRAAASAVRRTRDIARQRHTPTTLAVTTVIDTGLKGIGTTFPEDVLYRDDNDDRLSPFGLGIASSAGIEPFEGYEWPMHGTQIAYIVSGGPGMRRQYPALPSLLRFNVVNVVEPAGEGRFAITSGGVTAALNFAAGRAAIVNVSIASTERLSTESVISNNRLLLVVAAAGNDTFHLGVDGNQYPALYGGRDGDLREQVITVAAHDSDGKIAEFSNWGPEYVDIAAPGCDIALDLLGTHQVLNGTSFAAPIVTMTAAVLRAFGVTSPPLIKDRLRASVDFDPALGSKVASSGRLNVEKAVSLYEDVLEKRGQVPLVFGTWRTEALVKLCADAGFSEFEARKVRKVSLVDQTTKRIRVLHRDAGGHVQPTECIGEGDGLLFTTREGNPTAVPWGDMVDLVPRHYPAER